MLYLLYCYNMHMKYAVIVKKIKNKGRGVFATKIFSTSEIIEKCPVIVLSKKDAKLTQQTFLDNYLYDWDHYHKSCLPLGYGLIYNHSYQPNARYYFDHVKNFIIYKAIKNIKKGQEITVNYNFDPHDTSSTGIEGVPTI